MGITSNVEKLKSIITVQIEGFFTERFINLCKINNVKIWDIRNIVNGVIRFKMNASDFKKLRIIARKTKCSVKVKKKDGIYFKLFKYRKRKIIVALLCMIILFSIAFSTFIWNINIEGNKIISNEEVITALKESGLYIGKCKIGLDKKAIINNLRVNIKDITWVGIDIEGTLATVRLAEKTNLDEKDVQNTKIGDIIAIKDGVITRIVAEDGTAMLNENSYVEKGNTLIEGKMYSKVLEPYDVPAKGIVKANCTYTYENEYKYTDIKKEYTGKKKYTIGFSINSNENILNYLNKSKKYDISKSSKNFNIFGQNLSFDLYTCIEYKEVEIKKDRKELLNDSNTDIEKYLNEEILPNTINGTLVDKELEYIETDNGFKVIAKYIVSEDIGKFVERNESVKNEQYTY